MGLDEAIQEAGETRFVPIILTTLTAIGGLIPLVAENNPLYSPLALVIIWTSIEFPTSERNRSSLRRSSRLWRARSRDAPENAAT